MIYRFRVRVPGCPRLHRSRLRRNAISQHADKCNAKLTPQAMTASFFFSVLCPSGPWSSMGCGRVARVWPYGQASPGCQSCKTLKPSLLAAAEPIRAWRQPGRPSRSGQRFCACRCWVCLVTGGNDVTPPPATVPRASVSPRQRPDVSPGLPVGTLTNSSKDWAKAHLLPLSPTQMTCPWHLPQGLQALSCRRLPPTELP